MDLVPYAVPVFLALIAIEYAYGRITGLDTYRLNDSINSLSLGIISTSIKLLGLDIGGRVFALVAQYWAIGQLASASLLTWMLALLLYDFCYYWFHRISHERMIFWAAHVVHHQSEEFNLTTALRQTGSGFLLGWIFYVPCFLAGVPANVFVTVASVHLIYQFWIHSRHIPKLGPLEWVLVTASNHRVHHAQNARYVDRNYGGLLIIWDRLFGSFQEEDQEEQPVYGILGPLRSWNPLWANLHIYRQMLCDAWRAGALRDKLHVLAARTGWRPPDVAERFALGKRGLDDFQRYDPQLASGAKLYLCWQFLTLLLFAQWIEAVAPSLPAAQRIGLLACLLLGLVCIGVLMERPLLGRRLEFLRVLLGGWAAIWLLGLGLRAAAPGVVAYVLVSFALLMRVRLPAAEAADTPLVT